MPPSAGSSNIFYNIKAYKYRIILKEENNGWEIKGSFGYFVSGKMYPTDNQSGLIKNETMLSLEFNKEIFHEILKRDARLIRSLIVFVKELAESPAPPSTYLTSTAITEFEPAIPLML